MKPIDDARFAPLLTQKIIEHLERPEAATLSNVLSTLKFSGFEEMSLKSLEVIVNVALDVYVMARSKKIRISNVQFDNLNEERFAFELTKAIMKTMKNNGTEMYYDVTLMLEAEYPDDINKEMMDNLVRGTLAHLSGNL